MNSLFKAQGFFPFLVMVFLNAFVDLGHKIIIQNTVFKIYEGQTQIILIAIVNALILLPFVFLFSPAGFLSDRFAKPKVIRASAWAALGLTLMITLTYYMGWYQAAFGMTLLLAIQSAFYSPAKYGYIKELVGKESLSQANGLVQALTIVAILSGVFLFSIPFESFLEGTAITGESMILQTIAPLGWVLVACTAVELVLAYLLPLTVADNTEQRFEKRQYFNGQYLRRNIGVIRSNQVIWLSIVGLSVFWGISQVALAAFPAFAKETLGETNTIYIQGVLACAGIGIMLGSILAGKLSRHTIETGLVPLGAMGIVASLSVIPQLQSLQTLAMAFVFMGFFGGLFIVPLNSLIQFTAKDHQLGTVLAGNNWVQNLTMLSFLFLTVGFAVAGIESKGLFYLISVVALLGAIYTLWKLPQSLTRYLLGVLVRGGYKVDVVGLNNVPSQGGVLLLGNHISWLDWAMIQIACPRPVRFVMHNHYYQRWYLKWFLDLFGVIPIAAGKSKQALSSIRDSLNNDEVVCLFPEGGISRNGQLGEFKRGFEKSAEGASGVIVPFYLRGLWGSRFSRSSDNLQELRSTGRKREIIVGFGNAISMDSDATEVKRRVFDLSIQTWGQYVETLEPISLAWLRTSKRKGSAFSIGDSTGEKMNRYRVLTGVLLFSRLIKQRSKGQSIGFLLPTTPVGLITNMAALLLGRTIVNLNFTSPLAAIQAAVKKADIEEIYTSRRFVKKLQRKGIELDDLFSQVEVIYLEDLAKEISAFSKIATSVLVRLLPARMIYWLYGRKVNMNDTATILFSSGSEGEPKGVELSHRNLMANIKQVTDVLDVRADDVMMANLPLFHAFGLTVTGLLPLVEGVPVVCHPDPTDSVNIAKAIARFKATVYFGTSTFLRMFSRNRRVLPLMLESLRLVVAGAEKLRPEVRTAFQQKFNKDIFEGYGATETAPVASVNLLDKMDTSDWRVQQGTKLGTVGMPLPGSSFRIVDPETLVELPAGDDGLILIGGPQIMTGYLNDPEKTAEVIVELDGLRWYKSGDKGHLDEDGFLTIVDRYSRFAKIAGEMVSLGAAEEAIQASLPDMEIEVAAVNLPDGKKGERIVLLYVAEIEPDALSKTLRQSELSSLLLPAAVYPVEGIPKLGSGKVDFKGLKQLALEKVNQA